LKHNLILYRLSRRNFLRRCGWTAVGSAMGPIFLKGEGDGWNQGGEGTAGKPYGSGYFGEWIWDEFGLPAFRYTCDQTTDPKAISPTDAVFRSPTDQTHQVGNDRLVAAVSNYGYAQVRQDEGSPKFLNDYAPERGQYGAGIGYLTDGSALLSTLYPGTGESFDRIFGVGYLRKKVSGAGYAVDQVLFAPFGDDPVLVSEVTITNHRRSPADLHWVEYWGCQVYQFSYRSWMQASLDGTPGKAVELRRKFGDRFSHRFQHAPAGLGLLESKRFLGRTSEDLRLWQEVKDAISANAGRGGMSYVEPVEGEARYEDLEPPATFLVALEDPPPRFATNGKAFFGSGGVLRPAGLRQDLDGDLGAQGPESALLLERRFSLRPGERKIWRFIYGYLPQKMDLAKLVSKYREEDSSLWARSSRQWKKHGLRFDTNSAPWVGRELTWGHYYARSSLTYDDFFNEHIISQGEIYQYIMGLQAAARDPLQHALPFIFSDPWIVKEILRYTLKEVRSDGSIPYSITGHGMPMPTTQDDSSDLPLYMIWVVSEYVLATKDFAFLDEEITPGGLRRPALPQETVGNLLARCYRYLIDAVATGPHGIMRMLMDDWLDALVYQAVLFKQREQYVRVGESVLNSAMASYVFDRYASVLASVNTEPELVTDATRKAEEHRRAVRAQWTGEWFRRAWLGPELGWLGEDSLWIEPQSWAMIGGAAAPEQRRTLVRSIDELLLRPSLIGAMRWSPGFHPDKTKRPLGASGHVNMSLNGTLIWALSLLDGKLAWDLWTKNLLAAHAEAYPEVWYGTWSAPDSYDGVVDPYPGRQDPSQAALKAGKEDYSGVDFPVMNPHQHAWPLFTASKIIGLEFTPKGASVRAILPLETYRFTSPLFGFEKNTRGYNGWYAPSGGYGHWIISTRLPQEEIRRFTRIRVNGLEMPLRPGPDGTIEIPGGGGHGKPLRWSISA
jgi:Glycosyl hydrolase 36 superfamily, catalytic domain